MIMNNLDPQVAEQPQDLIVYGGTGKAARNWDCYHAIIKNLKSLENDETLIVQSGKPVGVFKTHPRGAARPDFQRHAGPQVGELGTSSAAWKGSA